MLFAHRALWLGLIAVAFTNTAGCRPPEKQSTEKAEYTRELTALLSKPAEYERMRSTATLVTQLLLARLAYGVGPITATLDEKGRAALKQY
jgi:hypothetical protein